MARRAHLEFHIRLTYISPDKIAISRQTGRVSTPDPPNKLHFYAFDDNVDPFARLFGSTIILKIENPTALPHASRHHSHPAYVQSGISCSSFGGVPLPGFELCRLIWVTLLSMCLLFPRDPMSSQSPSYQAISGQFMCRTTSVLGLGIEGVWMNGCYTGVGVLLTKCSNVYTLTYIGLYKIATSKTSRLGVSRR